jgi:hypothetical protein
MNASVKAMRDRPLKRAVASGYGRAAAASALLVPLAAIVGGMNLGNHNETVVRDVG